MKLLVFIEMVGETAPTNLGTGDRFLFLEWGAEFIQYLVSDRDGW